MASSHTSCILEVLQCLLCCEEETPDGSYDRRRLFPSRPLVAFLSRISTTITCYLQSRRSSSPNATTAAHYRNPHPPSSSPNTTADHPPPSSLSGASASITTATNSSDQSRPLINPSAIMQIRRRRPRPQDSLSIGVQIRVVIEEYRPPPETRIPATAGDYFIGPGLEQLIQQLAENDPNRYGPPPASKSAIETLPTIKIKDEILDSEMNQCAVCQDELVKDMEVKQMPCKHMYHSDCLLPWLEMHNSCPICRYELPTDDADYESNRRRGRAGTGRD